MNNKPPREGARWGDDPPPEPAPEPVAAQIPPEFVRLCSEYGEENVQKTLAIVEKTKSHFPQLSVLKRDPITVAGEVLLSAKNSMEVAASDGRVHSMPDTLKIADSLLGKTLAENPNITDLSVLNYSYGDEDSGKRGQQLASLGPKSGEVLAAIVGYIFIAVGVLLIFSPDLPPGEKIAALSVSSAIGGLLVWASRRISKKRKQLQE